MTKKTSFLQNDIIKTVGTAFVVSVISYFAHSSVYPFCAIPVWIFLLVLSGFFINNKILATSAAFLSEGAFALFLGDEVKTALISALAYALVTFVSFTSAERLKSFKSKKKKPDIMFAVLFIVISFALQFLYAGTPFGLFDAKAESEAYLSQKYPNQDFSEIKPRFDTFSRDYYCEVTFPNDGNFLMSRIVFADGGINDEFYLALCENASAKHRGEIITALRENSLDPFSVETKEIDITDDNGQVAFFYGSEKTECYNETMEFSVTFAKPMTQKRVFASFIENYFEKVKDLEFKKITFIALDSDLVPLFSCTLTGENTTDDIFEMCTLCKTVDRS